MMDHWCDFIWTFKLIKDDQIEVSISRPINQYRQTFLSDLSIGLKRFIPGLKEKASAKQVCSLIIEFYKNTKRVDRIKTFNENFHILLIPTRKASGFYPIVLYGMSYFDAKRKGHRIVKQQEFDLDRYCEFITQPTTSGDTVATLLDMIQETDKFGIQYKAAKETYALAESLFGIYAYDHVGEKSKHDIILFDVISKAANTVDTYKYDMRYLEKDIR